MKTIFKVVAFAITFTSAARAYDLDRIRSDYEALSKAETLAWWRADVEGAGVDFEAVRAPYANLFADKKLLYYIKDEADSARDAGTASRLRLLFATLAEGFIRDKTADVDVLMEEMDRTAHFYVPGFEEPVALRDYGRFFFSGDADPAVLEDLRCAKANYGVNALNPLRKHKLEIKRKAARELGYYDYVDFYFRVYGMDPETERARAAKFLDDTQGLFRAVADARAGALLGVPAAEVGREQKRAIYFAREFDGYFSADKSLDFTYAVLGFMGFDPTTMDNLTLDDEDRPDKANRVACYPVDPPADVRVNLRPMGTFFSYFPAFHEFGHALHNCYVSPDLPAEDRVMGRNDLTETYAFLFEHLFANRAFLVEEVGMTPSDADAFLRFMQFFMLSEVRGSAFETVYGIALESGEAEKPLAYYNELKDKYEVFRETPMDREQAYLALDEGFYGLAYFQAYLAEAQLVAKLEADFGERWYKDPAAGSYLRALFAKGNAIGAEGLCKELGYDGLNADYLLRRLESLGE